MFKNPKFDALLYLNFAAPTSQIAILTCSKHATNLALQVCKLAASSAWQVWQVCKFMTILQQVNASAEVTMVTHALSLSIATVLLQNCFASEWTLNVPIAFQEFCHKFDMTNLSLRDNIQRKSNLLQVCMLSGNVFRETIFLTNFGQKGILLFLIYSRKLKIVKPTWHLGVSILDLQPVRKLLSLIKCSTVAIYR